MRTRKKRRKNGPFINNVVNINNGLPQSGMPVKSGPGYQPHWRHRRKHRHGHGQEQDRRNERKPKLLRYCASCGMVDQNVVAKMDRNTIGAEAVNVMAYGARGLASDARVMARGAGKIAYGLGGLAMLGMPARRMRVREGSSPAPHEGAGFYLNIGERSEKCTDETIQEGAAHQA